MMTVVKSSEFTPENHVFGKNKFILCHNLFLGRHIMKLEFL